ncbi:methylated-DNA--[protein]-cysteine S-methyltransferase [Methanobrevibacter sp. AbM4]|uniref:methylated-DNA--[protein]-cysteine S-methyltransferase n=1 Tax=Methanobrevibacter sp. AbM4 TaxID=224719 RepID=UPI0003348B92|nr:methylated-DNA--[protein]-cysteine S-methyltransferase [Methanobrevibacter sp. AbM4]AGN16719.1 6-O-methylguanine DNA methyltransferase Ogt [Methanobrevibacter sp. AbM4]
MEMELKEFTIEKTIIGPITIVFQDSDNVLIKNIILSTPDLKSKEIAYKSYDNLDSVSFSHLNKRIKKLVLDIQDYLNGKDFKFSLDNFDFSGCSPFEREVLNAEYNTKRGSVNTYGELAKEIGHPKAYRAVGNALRKNPFPIVIPCHRTIKKDRTIGGFNGYQGGIESKEILLSLENVEVQQKKVISESPVISLNKKAQKKLDIDN